MEAAMHQEQHTSSSPDKRRWDQILIALVLLSGLTGSWLVYRVLSANADLQLREKLGAVSLSVMDAFTVELNRATETVHGLGLMIAAQKTLERNEFQDYCRSALAGMPTLSALQWQPIVPAAMLADFEASAQAEGLANFQVVEPSGNTLIPVKPRAEYVPILFAWPENASVLGLDLGFSAARMSSKELARDTGKLIASEIFPLISKDLNTSNQLGLSISVGVYRPGPISTILERRQQLMGYAGGVIKIATIVQSATLRARTANLDIRVFDLTNGTREAVYASGDMDNHDQPFGAYALALPVTVGARPWEVVLHPRTEFFAQNQRNDALIALITGLLATLLLSFSLYRQQRHRRMVDITRAATRAAESALSEERQHLSNVISGTNAGTWEWNIQTNEIVFNERWAEMLGYTLEALAPINTQLLTRLTHPNDLLLAQQAVHRHITGETATYECELRLRHKAGHWIWVSSHGRIFSHTPDGKPEWIAGIQLEISERKRLTQMLADTKAAIDQYAIMSISDARGRIVYANDKFCAISQYSQEELLGKDHRILNSGYHPKAFMHDMWATIQSGKPWHGEVKNRAKDGSFYWVSSTIAPILGPDGQPEQYISIRYEITENKLYEAKLMEARDAAEAASRTKSEFLANMSHEIRTPMNGILGMLKPLQHTELTPRQLDYAAKTEHAAQSLLGIINDLLDFSKVEAGKMTLDQHGFHPDRLLRDLSAITSANLGNKPIELLFSIDPEIPDVLIGDELRLKQILLNLAGNAVKFTEKGEVVIELKVLFHNETITDIGFSVTDSGIGIPADKLQIIFEGFSQAEASTTRRFGGTGLGLAISQRLVSLMGGQLEVESTLGVGSRFHFSLRFENGIDEANPPAPDRSALPPRDFRVLLVDDNDLARQIQQATIQSLGWQCDTAASGAEALERVDTSERNHTVYDAIFMDWLMPGMDGWETIKHLRARPSAKPAPVIIMVTANGRETLTEKMRSEHAALDGFLIKPVTASMLFDAVIDATTGQAGRVKTRKITDQNRLQGMRLLVVEDNLLNQQIARELLSHEGALVEVASNGAEGIERALAARPPFDAVLMDIQMPDMDGYEATKKIRLHAEQRTLPIIAMTANAMESDRQACLNAGMNDHVGKPIDLGKLIQVLLKHVNAVELESSMKQPSPTITRSNDMSIKIDHVSALQRLGDDLDLFIMITQSFIQDTARTPDTVREHVARGELKEAQRAIHTLKGLAGTLGIATLADFAAAYEAQIKSGEAVDHETQLNQLSGLLAQSTQAITQLTAKLTATDGAESVTAEPQADLDQALSELESLLQSGNMRATSCMTTLVQSRAGLGTPNLTELKIAVGQLDFQRAQTLCQTLRAELP